MPRSWTKWEKAEMFLFAGPVTVASIAILALFILSVLSTLFLFAPHRPRNNAYRAACQSNLKQVALAVLQYHEDNDAYPLAQNPPNPAWAAEYPSSILGKETFQCRVDKNATNTQKNSYGYNANLSAKDVWEKNVASVILNFEVVARADNQTQTGKTFAAVTARERHLGGANYSFADGHVRWFKINRISNTKPDGKNVTFGVE